MAEDNVSIQSSCNDYNFGSVVNSASNSSRESSTLSLNRKLKGRLKKVKKSIRDHVPRLTKLGSVKKLRVSTTGSYDVSKQEQEAEETRSEVKEKARVKAQSCSHSKAVSASSSQAHVTDDRTIFPLRFISTDKLNQISGNLETDSNISSTSDFQEVISSSKESKRKPFLKFIARSKESKEKAAEQGSLSSSLSAADPSSKISVRDDSDTLSNASHRKSKLWSKILSLSRKQRKKKTMTTSNSPSGESYQQNEHVVSIDNTQRRSDHVSSAESLNNYADMPDYDNAEEVDDDEMLESNVFHHPDSEANSITCDVSNTAGDRYNNNTIATYSDMPVVEMNKDIDNESVDINSIEVISTENIKSNTSTNQQCMFINQQEDDSISIDNETRNNLEKLTSHTHAGKVKRYRLLNKQIYKSDPYLDDSTDLSDNDLDSKRDRVNSGTSNNLIVTAAMSSASITNCNHHAKPLMKSRIPVLKRIITPVRINEGSANEAATHSRLESSPVKSRFLPILKKPKAVTCRSITEKSKSLCKGILKLHKDDVKVHTYKTSNSLPRLDTNIPNLRPYSTKNICDTAHRCTKRISPRYRLNMEGTLGNVDDNGSSTYRKIDNKATDKEFDLDKELTYSGSADAECSADIRDVKDCSVSETKEAAVNTNQESSVGGVLSETKQHMEENKQFSLNLSTKGLLNESMASSLDGSNKSSLNGSKESSLNDSKQSSLNGSRESIFNGSKQSSLKESKESSLNNSKESVIEEINVSESKCYMESDGLASCLQTSLTRASLNEQIVTGSSLLFDKCSTVNGCLSSNDGNEFNLGDYVPEVRRVGCQSLPHIIDSTNNLVNFSDIDNRKSFEDVLNFLNSGLAYIFDSFEPLPESSVVIEDYFEESSLSKVEDNYANKMISNHMLAMDESVVSHSSLTNTSILSDPISDMHEMPHIEMDTKPNKYSYNDEFSKHSAAALRCSQIDLSSLIDKNEKNGDCLDTNERILQAENIDFNSDHTPENTIIGSNASTKSTSSTENTAVNFIASTSSQLLSNSLDQSTHITHGQIETSKLNIDNSSQSLSITNEPFSPIIEDVLQQIFNKNAESLDKMNYNAQSCVNSEKQHICQFDDRPISPMCKYMYIPNDTCNSRMLNENYTSNFRPLFTESDAPSQTKEVEKITVKGSKQNSSDYYCNMTDSNTSKRHIKESGRTEMINKEDRLSKIDRLDKVDRLDKSCINNDRSGVLVDDTFNKLKDICVEHMHDSSINEPTILSRTEIPRQLGKVDDVVLSKKTKSNTGRTCSEMTDKINKRMIINSSERINIINNPSSSDKRSKAFQKYMEKNIQEFETEITKVPSFKSSFPSNPFVNEFCRSDEDGSAPGLFASSSVRRLNETDSTMDFAIKQERREREIVKKSTKFNTRDLSEAKSSRVDQNLDCASMNDSAFKSDSRVPRKKIRNTSHKKSVKKDYLQRRPISARDSKRNLSLDLCTQDINNGEDYNDRKCLYKPVATRKYSDNMVFINNDKSKVSHQSDKTVTIKNRYSIDGVHLKRDSRKVTKSFSDCSTETYIVKSKDENERVIKSALPANSLMVHVCAEHDQNIPNSYVSLPSLSRISEKNNISGKLKKAFDTDTHLHVLTNVKGNEQKNMNKILNYRDMLYNSYDMIDKMKGSDNRTTNRGRQALAHGSHHRYKNTCSTHDPSLTDCDAKCYDFCIPVKLAKSPSFENTDSTLKYSMNKRTKKQVEKDVKQCVSQSEQKVAAGDNISDPAENDLRQNVDSVFSCRVSDMNLTEEDLCNVNSFVSDHPQIRETRSQGYEARPTISRGSEARETRERRREGRETRGEYEEARETRDQGNETRETRDPEPECLEPRDHGDAHSDKNSVIAKLKEEFDSLKMKYEAEHRRYESLHLENEMLRTKISSVEMEKAKISKERDRLRHGLAFLKEDKEKIEEELLSTEFRLVAEQKEKLAIHEKLLRMMTLCAEMKTDAKREVEDCLKEENRLLEERRMYLNKIKIHLCCENDENSKNLARAKQFAELKKQTNNLRLEVKHVQGCCFSQEVYIEHLHAAYNELLELIRSSDTLTSSHKISNRPSYHKHNS